MAQRESSAYVSFSGKRKTVEFHYIKNYFDRMKAIPSQAILCILSELILKLRDYKRTEN
jgi:hypothetical protein